MKTFFRLCLAILLSAPAVARADDRFPLVDKTLVVWTAPADPPTRGGSALTIDNRRGGFDGIVFGELAPGVWMAGSDYYRRSLTDQSGLPTEPANPADPVQIAIVYRGRDISVYRNAGLYSRHTAGSDPLPFGAQSIVMIGRRHRTQADNSAYAGTVDDARIYDRALTPDQLAALRPDVADGPALWAWWTFDDPAATERTGRYRITTLSGGATVADGKLVLDGRSAGLVAETGQPVVHTYETPARPENPPDDWFSYHLAHPGPGNAFPGDPNCAFYRDGRYHLHYIYDSGDGPAFAHVSGTDLVRWKWHPTTLTPSVVGHGMFSGTGFLTKDGRPAIIYHGQGAGRNFVAIAEDDSLEKWGRPVAVEPTIRPGQDASLIAHWDPDAWIDGDVYYALSGGSPGSGKPPTLFRSNDLQSWEYLGLFLSHDMPDVGADEDISCPNFFPIGGNKHMLLCISHNKGCRYHLGTWENEKFTPEVHARMNWHGLDCFAPESVLAPDGRRIMWAWCYFTSTPVPQTGIQTLPRELKLGDDGTLRIRPARELATLRSPAQSAATRTVPAGNAVVIPEFAGRDRELRVTLNRGDATRFGLRVRTDADGRGGLPVVVDTTAGTLEVGDARAPFALGDREDVTLRIFLDHSIVEVFANDRQAVVYCHPHPPEHTAVALISDGAETRAESLEAWPMQSIYAR